jgi:hypothetical protein
MQRGLPATLWLRHCFAQRGPASQETAPSKMFDHSPNILIGNVDALGRRQDGQH